MGAVSRDHGRDLSQNTSIAALVQTLPGEVRDVVFQSLDALPPYIGIRGKVRDLVANRVSLQDSGAEPDGNHGEYGDGDMEWYLGAVKQKGLGIAEGRAISRGRVSRKAARRARARREKVPAQQRERDPQRSGQA